MCVRMVARRPNAGGPERKGRVFFFFQQNHSRFAHPNSRGIVVMAKKKKGALAKRATELKSAVADLVAAVVPGSAPKKKKRKAKKAKVVKAAKAVVKKAKKAVKKAVKKATKKKAKKK